MRRRKRDLRAAGAVLVLAIRFSACAASSPIAPTPPGPEFLTALPVPPGSSSGSFGTPTSSSTPIPVPAPPGDGGTPGPVALAITSVSPATATAGTFTLAITGTAFDPSSVQVVVTGPACAAADPCILSNEELTTKTSTRIAATVAIDNPGTFSIRVRNGPAGTLSNTFTLFVTEATLPSISGISPARPAVSSTPQTLSVIGSGFAAGLTATLVRPGGGTSTLSGSDIQNVTRGSFRMVVTLADAGAYSIRVSNPGGQQSNTFNFPVAPAATLPAITSISPANPTPGATPQTISVSGRSFQEGLTVTVVSPGGSLSTLSRNQIQNVTSNSFRMIVVLRDPGAYTLRVTNPTGQQSNSFSFTAQIVQRTGLNP